jgi:two-component system NtrC family sensor kinase
LTSLHPDSLVEEIYKLLAEIFQPQGTTILLLDNLKTVTKVIPGASSRVVGTSPRFITRIVKERSPLLLSTGAETLDCDAVLPNAASVLAAPIFNSAGSVVGVIDLESIEQNAFDRSWVDVVNYLADLVGLSLEIAAKVHEIEAKAEQLIAAEREKRKHVENLALEVKHQFSSPVQVIQLQAGELLLKEVPELAGDVRTKAETRIRMILDNAKAVEGACRYLEGISEELPLHKERVDISSLLEVCGDEVRPELESKHIRLSFSRASREPIQLEADPLRIRYSIQCLLKNAIEAIDERRDQILEPEFNPLDSTDEVSINLEASEPDRVAFTVADTGVGVSPENKARLFQPLFSTKRRPQTGGVGLFSVKRIIDSHGGQIDFSSEPGRGASFRVSLPKSREK